ncbi:hypothetical protein EPN95_03680 [Patescibacteria group bacterium]|nr:MAG: hypothetical protein EPN95_03680 [Patescibacteria group bacterium]
MVTSEKETFSEQTIGVVGAAGDLGRKVARTAERRGFTVFESDKRLLGSASLGALMENSDIVHFCIPASGFEEIHELHPDQVAVLHDSVMATSLATNAEFFGGQADIVHMLMNKSKTVVVEENSPHLDSVRTHMKALGWRSASMSAREHDEMAASSQAIFALGVSMQLPKLATWHEEGLLTPSAEAAYNAFLDRSAKWTPQTLNSILSNPELPKTLEEMLQFLEDRKKKHDDE